MSLQIEKTICIGCGACKAVCPVEAIISLENNKYLILEDKCINCEACKEICPVNAIFYK